MAARSPDTSSQRLGVLERAEHARERDDGQVPRLAREEREVPRARSAPYFDFVPLKAACSAAMSILTIFSMASVARLALARSGSFIISVRTVGTICHESPNRSFSHPHCSALPSFSSAFQ